LKPKYHKKKEQNKGVVVHACDPRYLRGGGRKIRQSPPEQKHKTLSENKVKQKGL
jgi:hypothetical protein